MERKFWLKPLFAVLLVSVLVLAGCGDDGDDGSTGMSAYEIAVENGFEGTEEEWLESLHSATDVDPESCATCHSGAGDAHQATYDSFTSNGVDDQGNTYSAALYGAGVTKDGAVVTIPFTVTVNGTELTSLAELDQFTSQTVYALGFEDGTAYNFGGVTSYNVDHFEATVTTSGGGDLTDTTDFMGAVVLKKGEVSPADAPIGPRFQPYDVIIGAGGSVGAEAAAYESTANAEGCEKCHGTPYMKHANYIVDVVDDNDFLLCVGCHKDGQLSHATQGFQLLHDDPAAYAAGETPDPDKYDTDRTLMLDVHMSHNMEFAYPQGMNNCVTCHEGKLDQILTDENFTFETCRSCHAVDRLREKFPEASYHDFADLSAVTCNACHENASGLGFQSIHSGYAPVYYTADGEKYADDVTISIDSASLSADNQLTFEFSATSSIADVNVDDIAPELYIAGYGYDTKDFIIPSYRTSAVGFYPGGDSDYYDVTYDSTTATWTAVVDLAGAGFIDDAVKRIEIAVSGNLQVDGINVALNSPSRTFNLADNAFEDYYSDIVDFENKCSTCHDQMMPHGSHHIHANANVTQCRMCHTPIISAGHLEMQSMSFDSYIHAIHAMQPFDIGRTDFTDPVAELEYEHHVESTYPMFTTTNCESCHNEGAYNVPDQSKSLPGVLSASASSATLAENGLDRNIGDVPSYVTGPASRACGSCHRAAMINEDAAGELASFNAHTGTFGYMVEEEEGVLESVIENLMSLFQ